MGYRAGKTPPTHRLAGPRLRCFFGGNRLQTAADSLLVQAMAATMADRALNVVQRGRIVRDDEGALSALGTFQGGMEHDPLK